MSDSDVMRLLQHAEPREEDQATAAVLEAAMRSALDVTHECGEPEASDRAVLQTFWDAIRHAARFLPNAPSET